MSNVATSAAVLSVANVRAIGKGDRLTAEVAAAVVAATPETYDWSARGAVPAAIRTALGVTPETEPRQKTGPAGDQVTTDYGRGFDRLRKAVSALVREPKAKPVRLAVNLSGDDVDGGTVTIDETHPLYSVLMGLFSTEDAEVAA